MSTNNEVFKAVESAVREGWSIEEFLVHCREAWMYTLSDKEQEAESKWAKYMKSVNR